MMTGFGVGAGSALYQAFRYGIDEIDLTRSFVIGVLAAGIVYLVATGAWRKKGNSTGSKP